MQATTSQTTPALEYAAEAKYRRMKDASDEDGSIALELEPIDPNKIPVIFLDNVPPPTKMAADPSPKPVSEREARLKSSLEAANAQFRSWRFLEAEKSYLQIVKQLPPARSAKLQTKLTETFFKRGLIFYREKRYSKALEVLRVALHFDANNREAHRYLARSYRLLGKNCKAKYHERMVKKLGHYCRGQQRRSG